MRRLLALLCILVLVGPTTAQDITRSVAGSITVAPLTSAQLAAGLSDETGTNLAVFNTGPTLSNPIITNIAPGADFTLTQNSVASFKSENTGATADTLHLKAGLVGIGVPVPLYSLDINDGTSALHMSSTGIDSGAYVSATAASTVAHGAGVFYNGSTFTAKSTSASLLLQAAGTFGLYTDTSLTAGNTYIPTVRLSVNSAGIGIVGTLTASAIAAKSGAQTGELCYNTSGGVITYDTTLLCTTSLEEYKEDFGQIRDGLAIVQRLRPFWGRYTLASGQQDRREQPFLGAHQVEQAEPRLAGYDADGQLAGVRYKTLAVVLIAAIQEQQEQINRLTARLLQLEHR